MTAKPGASGPAVRVLIASPLTVKEVERLRDRIPPRVQISFQPELLPVPRYPADHHGIKPELTSSQRGKWLELLHAAEVLFDFDWEAPLELRERAPRLRWIQATSAGVGPFVEKLRLRDAGVQVTTAAGVHAQPLAEFVGMAILHFRKDFPRLDAWKDQHKWERYSGLDLLGTKALVVGLGHVGRRIAGLCSALGIEVIGLRRTISDESVMGVSRLVDQGEIDTILPDIDYLILAAPETASTRNMFSAHRLSLIGQSAVVINVGRGSLIDETALTKALQTGRLAGAALDVFREEPLPTDSPLWDLPNVIISPHSASTVVQENDRIVDIFIDNMHRYLDGAPLVNLYDYGRHY